MASVYLQDSTLTNIANAIRTKGGTTAQLKPNQMPAAIQAIVTGGGGGIEKIDAPAHYLNSSGKIATEPNGWTYTSISDSVGWTDSIPLSALGVAAADFQDSFFCIGVTCRPKTAGSNGNFIIPNKRCRLLIFPILGKILNPPDIFNTVADRWAPCFIARPSESTGTSTTIGANTNCILENSFIGILGSYIPCWAAVSGNNLYVYILGSNGNIQNPFDSSNKIRDTGNVQVWRK